MNSYSYDGPVMLFDKCIVNCWHGDTFAPSEKKARNNLEYQFKKKYNYAANTKISLPGKVKQIDEELAG